MTTTTIEITGIAHATVKATGKRYVVRQVRAASGKQYNVWQNERGVVCYCSCPDHTNRAHQCKHMRALAQMLQAEEIQKAEQADSYRSELAQAVIAQAEAVLAEEQSRYPKYPAARVANRKATATLNPNVGFQLMR